ncbi:hypothetical protein BDZ91DRAFT_710341 [Kalaharituber pfeilii]|nr:hypothetical protein BDZ91DRAFT_710341 [Kalaharituber pfeilii]
MKHAHRSRSRSHPRTDMRLQEGSSSCFIFFPAWVLFPNRRVLERIWRCMLMQPHWSTFWQAGYEMNARAGQTIWGL